MKNVNLKSGSTALVIVAHPDDETIWMGGTILKSKNVKWTIFSLCRQSDTDRGPKFSRVCQYYGAEGIMSDLDDENKLSVDETIPLIKQLISEKIGDREFDYLFTHGENGDYGHPRHIGVHRAVREMIDEKKFRVKKVFYFNYRKELEQKMPAMTMCENSEYILKLSSKEYLKKRRIVSDIHGYPFDGVDVNLSPNPEAFISYQPGGFNT